MSLTEMGAMCLTCGEVYGRHLGMGCRDGKGVFVEAVLNETYWSCYTLVSGGVNCRRILPARDFESARKEYERVGNHTFVTAEPYNDFPIQLINEEQIKARIALLSRQVTSDKQTGPRKPIPAIVAEVHNAAPIDAKKAWDAVVAACGGRQS